MDVANQTQVLIVHRHFLPHRAPCCGTPHRWNHYSSLHFSFFMTCCTPILLPPFFFLICAITFLVSKISNHHKIPLQTACRPFCLSRKCRYRLDFFVLSPVLFPLDLFLFFPLLLPLHTPFSFLFLFFLVCIWCMSMCVVGVIHVPWCLCRSQPWVLIFYLIWGRVSFHCLAKALWVSRDSPVSVYTVRMLGL